MPENKSQTTSNASTAAADQRPVPSQAEGDDLDVVESGVGYDERPVPSQAEGDRDTIEQDLAEKEEKENTATSGKA